MSSSKGASGSGSYLYYGTIAAWFCQGPCDGLHRILVNKEAIWEGTKTRGAEDYVDLTAEIDAQWFTGGGYFRLYWGTATQTADAALPGHPAYRHRCYFVAKNFLFSKTAGGSNAPDVEVILSRKPVADAALVASEDLALDDGQANPVAVLAELCTSLGGLLLPVAALKGASWQAASAWCSASADRKAATYGSFFIADRDEFRAVAQMILEMFDGWLRYDAAGLLDIGVRDRGLYSGTLTTLDAKDLTEMAGPEGGDWGDVPTGAVVKFIDRDKDYKETSEKADSRLALRVRGEEDRESLDRPHIKRRDQALRHAREWLRLHSRPPLVVALPGVRPARAVTPAGADLMPGDKLWVDVEPEPGGTGLAQLATVLSREEPFDGPVALTLEAELTAAAVVYQPQGEAANPQDAEVPSITHARAIPLPPGGWGFPLGVAVVASRPADDVTGLRVLFDVDSGSGVFPELGPQPGYAVRCTLDTAVDGDETTLRLTLADGASGRDAYLAARTPDGDVEARADVLLAILVDVDGDGRVDIDSDDRPQLEFCSIVSRTAVDADTHDYTVLRGRKGLASREWTTTAEVWIIPATNLLAWTHPDIDALVQSGAPGYLRLVAFSGYGEDEAASLPERSFIVPASYDVAPRVAWTNPTGNSGDTDASGNITVTGTATDRQGDLISLRMDSRRSDDGSAETVHQDVGFPSAASRAFSQALTFAGDASLYLTYTLRIEVRDRAGNVTTSVRTIVRPPTGTPSTPAPPSISPPDGEIFYPSTLATITVAAPATEIHWKTSAVGSDAPTSYSTHTGTSKSITVSSTLRLWARASDGTNHSAWVHADFYRENSGGQYLN